MIKFRQKIFSEYDAMRSLYVEIMKRTKGDKKKFPVITTNELPAILRGNNVVVERFVISTSFFNRDKYRMYIKIGAKAKLPDEVRLPGAYYEKRIANTRLNLNPAIMYPKPQDGQQGQQGQQGPGNGNGTGNGNNPRFNPRTKQGSDVGPLLGGLSQKEFSKDKIFPYLSANVDPYVDLSYTVHKLLGEAIKYDKKARTLVLEFDSISDAIDALNVLPFGINYSIYLLNA